MSGSEMMRDENEKNGLNEIRIDSELTQLPDGTDLEVRKEVLKVYVKDGQVVKEKTVVGARSYACGDRKLEPKEEAYLVLRGSSRPGYCLHCNKETCPACLVGSCDVCGKKICKTCVKTSSCAQPQKIGNESFTQPSQYSTGQGMPKTESSEGYEPPTWAEIIGQTAAKYSKTKKKKKDVYQEEHDIPPIPDVWYDATSGTNAQDTGQNTTSTPHVVDAEYYESAPVKENDSTEEPGCLTILIVIVIAILIIALGAGGHHEEEEMKSEQPHVITHGMAGEYRFK